MNETPRIAGIELGGTKAIALIAKDRQVVKRLTVPTTNPERTLGTLREQLLEWHAEKAISALGIASFGPLRLDSAAADFGRILATPKPGWSGTDIASALVGSFNFPWRIDTDVNGAAFAEWRWGAGQGSTCLCYLTIGTGVGGSLLIDGKPVHGMLHPELGHTRFRRAEGDMFHGICAFHGDCVEGLVSGPALRARFGRPAEEVPTDHPGWSFVAQDLAELVSAILLAASPHKILIGGGVGLGVPFLFPMIRAYAAELLADYLPDFTFRSAQDIIIQPGLGSDAGPLGAVALGATALALHFSQTEAQCCGNGSGGA